MRSIVSVVLLSAVALFAQSDRGTITGTISDPAGAVVANAAIEAKNTGTGIVTTVASSATGNYTIPSLPSGTYEIKVSVPGFKNAVRQGLQVQNAQTIRIDIGLEVGNAAESVTVTEAAPLLKTESGELSHVVPIERMDNLPVLQTGGSAGSGGIRNPITVVALMPGSAGADVAALPPQSSAISIKGLTPGVAYDLAQCCHPVPGDRIVGLRRPDAGIEVHAIQCPVLAELADRTDEETDWVDVSWGDESEGATARISVMVKNEPGALGILATIIGQHKANIINVRLDTRDTRFHTNLIDVEVHDLQHLMRLIAALRAADVVSLVERV